jgi:hypothetical protein
MNVAIIFAVIILVLFVLSYITKRRFSVLGLALAAGSILSTLWAQELTPVVRQAGFNVQNPPLITIVSILLVLLPAVVLLFSGPSYRDMPRRIIGAVLFASLAFALLIEPLGIALTLEDQGKMVYDFFVENRVYIITVGLVIAIIDLLSVHTSKTHKPEKH